MAEPELIRSRSSKNPQLYACTTECTRRTWLHLRIQNLRLAPPSSLFFSPKEVKEGLQLEHEGVEGVHYKVGRTQNLTRRMHQWSRSCSYTPILMEFFPSQPVLTPRPTSSTSSLTSVVRKVDTGKQGKSVKCVVTHRVERLIHLELEDRFGRADIWGEGGCRCGRVHKEWFRGWDAAGGGWSEVRDVIARWVGFARIAYGEINV
jgi:T5orf172 domain